MKTAIRLFVLTILILIVMVLTEGAYGKDIRVMVIDTGVSKHEALQDHVQYTESEDYRDTEGHGTQVAGIVLKGNRSMQSSLCKEVKLFSCKYYKFFGDNMQRSIDCVKRATEMKMDYISYSSGGPAFNQNEYNAYSNFVAGGGIAVVAAGNDGNNLESVNYYPASYAFGVKGKVKALKNIIVVENEGRDGKLMVHSNRHPLALRALGENIISTAPDNKFKFITGTSAAAPAVLHSILKQRCEDL